MHVGTYVALVEYLFTLYCVLCSSNEIVACVDACDNVYIVTTLSLTTKPQAKLASFDTHSIHTAVKSRLN